MRNFGATHGVACRLAGRRGALRDFGVLTSFSSVETHVTKRSRPYGTRVEFPTSPHSAPHCGVCAVRAYGACLFANADRSATNEHPARRLGMTKIKDLTV